MDRYLKEFDDLNKEDIVPFFDECISGFLDHITDKDNLTPVKKALNDRLGSLPYPSRSFPLSEFLAIHLLIAYKKSKVILVQNNYYVSRTEVLYLCNKYIIQLFNVVEIYLNTSTKLPPLKEFLFNLLSFLEYGGVFAHTYVYTTRRQEKLIKIAFHNKLIMSTEPELKLKTKPLEITQPNRFNYYLDENYLNMSTYIHQNASSHTPTKASQLQTLNLLLRMRFYIDEEVLNLAIHTLLKLYNLPHHQTPLQLYLDMQLNFIKISAKGYKVIDPKYNQLFNVYSLMVFKQNIEEYRGGFFYKFYFDFRGRLYADSNISYTQNSYVRYLLHTGEFTINEIQTYRCPNHVTAAYEEFAPLYNWAAANDVQKSFLINTLFELGKLIKNKKDNYQGYLQYKDFLELGVLVLKDVGNTLYNLDITDHLIKVLLIYRLTNYQTAYTKKYFFYKDATASGLQVLSLFLKPKDPEVAK